jgi:hypothetical protein
LQETTGARISNRNHFGRLSFSNAITIDLCNFFIKNILFDDIKTEQLRTNFIQVLYGKETWKIRSRLKAKSPPGAGRFVRRSWQSKDAPPASTQL